MITIIENDTIPNRITTEDTLRMFYTGLIHLRTNITYLNVKMIDGKPSVVYLRKSLIPRGVKFKSHWRQEKRKVKPDQIPFAYYQTGPDIYGLYSIKQTISTKRN